MFFGLSSNPNLRNNQQRQRLLSEEAMAYEGRKENIAADITWRKARKPARADKDDSSPIPTRFSPFVVTVERYGYKPVHQSFEVSLNRLLSH